MALPIPRVPPVTIADFPSNCFSLMLDIQRISLRFKKLVDADLGELHHLVHLVA